MRKLPTTDLTELAAAAALAGSGAFLHRESVLDLLGLGQFNPDRIRVAICRRVRRSLPGWIELEFRTDVPDEELTRYEGIPATTIRRALSDVRHRMPRERWLKVVDQAWRRGLINQRDLAELEQMEPAR